MTGTQPRQITFDQVQVGDTIRTEWFVAGMRQTREGVVAELHDTMAATAERGVLASVSRANQTIALLDRPAPPRMDEPTQLGAVVVAGGPGYRYLAVRTGGPTSGPWRWRESVTGVHLCWEAIADPRPATPQEIEEGRVIEP